MDKTTLIQKFKSTMHEMADSKKAMTTVASVLASGFTMLGGIALSHYGKKFGLDAVLADKIPEYAAYMSIMIVGAAVNYVHGQAKVDAETVKQNGSPASLKANAQALATEALMASLTPAPVTVPESTPAAS